MVAKLIALVVPLGLDTFAVAAALGAAGLPASRGGRVSALMVSFEMGMPLIGVAVGAPLGHLTGSTADYIAIAVLGTFGAYTLRRADDEDEKVARLGNVSGWPAVLLGVSISLDELAIGFSLGLLGLPVIVVVILIGLQTLVLSQLGMRAGASLSQYLREGAERLAGLALVGLALILLVEKIA
jgi:putative Mn2+ efflux pump MntP